MGKDLKQMVKELFWLAVLGPIGLDVINLIFHDTGNVESIVLGYIIYLGALLGTGRRIIKAIRNTEQNQSIE